MNAQSRTVVLYGIKNCDTMKNARTWLDAHKIDYRFHDYKLSGIERSVLENWNEQVGWQVLLNRAGTTFRKLADSDKENLDARKAIDLALKQPSMIKRPVLSAQGKLLVGFKPQEYAALFDVPA